MRHVRILALLILTTFACVSAFGQTSVLPDPNVGFCNVPASSSCGADPNLITSQTKFGMWSFGGNDSTNPWYLIVSIPEATHNTATAPTITSDASNPINFTLTLKGEEFLLPSPPTEDVYTLVSSLDGGLNGDNSMSNVNMFPFEPKGTVDDAVFVFSVTPGFAGATPYAFDVAGSGLPQGTFLSEVGTDTKGAQMSTPFTTSGLIPSSSPIMPDSGVTLMMLGGALVGLETLRRRLRA